MSQHLFHRGRRAGSAVIAATGLAALTCFPMSSSSAAAAASGTTLTAQTAYKCLLTAQGFSQVTPDGVTVRIQLAAPASVTPGERVHLSGTLTVQFSEQLRQTAATLGATTVDAYSTTMSVGMMAAGKASTIDADRWQTSPTQIGNPLAVSGALTFPAVKVPDTAKGSLQLQMPQNGVAKNPISGKPAKVAFVSDARVSGPGGVFIVKTACYLPDDKVPTIGRIPIASAPSEAASASAGATTGTSVVPPPTSSPAIAGGSETASGSSAAAAPVVEPSAVQPQPQQSAPAAVGVEAGSAAPVVPATLMTASDTRSGVYVPTSLLVLAAFLICVAALGYAAWANHRVRSIRNALDQ